jgi:ABC-type sugar transport system ATPase subunit
MASVCFDNVSKVFADGSKAVDGLNLEVADGELLVLVGPSGCGKSTALRLLAGLESVSAGDIRIDGRSVLAQSPQQRNIAMVFQNYALYPHMSVYDNLAFPLKMARLPRTERDRRVRETAEALALTALLAKKPAALSGGQRQRVAMGRAMVRHPKVFLLDEPLSNLDAKLRTLVRGEIATLQRRLRATMIYVTHDQSEAMTLGQRVVVLRRGRLQQAGPPQQLYDYPVNRFVASFLGSPAMNLFEVNVEQQGQRIVVGEAGGRFVVPADYAAALRRYPRQRIHIGLRPEAVRLAAAADSDAIQLTLAVRREEHLGHERLVYCASPWPVVSADGARCQSGELVLRAAGGAPLGSRVDVSIDLAQLHVFDLDGQRWSIPPRGEASDCGDLRKQPR